MRCVHSTKDEGLDPDNIAAAKNDTAARLDRRFELLEAILLAVATVLTAWSAFQATKWGASRPTTTAGLAQYAPSRCMRRLAPGSSASSTSTRSRRGWPR